MVANYIRTRKPIHEKLIVILIVVKRPVPHPVTSERELGQSAFGHVFKAVLQDGHTFITVAVKTCETKVMREYKRENLMQFIGISC
uniref:PK_Tyr_Ser-Thr domain-containing protein n=1 Tax=Elaeophora elaphi TaxID=1147741 RepID=A0A0R3RRF1_9BILA